MAYIGFWSLLPPIYRRYSYLAIWLWLPQ